MYIDSATNSAYVIVANCYGLYMHSVMAKEFKAVMPPLLAMGGVKRKCDTMRGSDVIATNLSKRMYIGHMKTVIRCVCVYICDMVINRTSQGGYW